VRARALAEKERFYVQRVLENVDTWWPVYAQKHPTAEKTEIVRRLAAQIAKSPARGFSDVGADGFPSTPTRRVDVLPHLEPSRFFRRPGISELISPLERVSVGGASGVVRASEFKWYDVETKDHSSTQDLHLVSPLGASSWSGAVGANFWEGFARLDSFWDDINIFDGGSVADRVVHMAVLKVTPPAPNSDVSSLHAVFRTSLFVHLPRGAEVLNDWGWLDDEDEASIQIDFCCAVQPEGGGFPDADAFSFTSALSYGSSNHHDASAGVDLVHSVAVSSGVSPNVYLGIRLTFAGADCRLQTGFKQNALDAYFGFRYPDTSSLPGLSYSYVPDHPLVMG